MPDDTVIFSSSAIPGNAMSINRVINKLYLKGATVYTTSDDANVHTSGHAKQDELKLLLDYLSLSILCQFMVNIECLKVLLI